MGGLLLLVSIGLLLTTSGEIKMPFVEYRFSIIDFISETLNPFILEGENKKAISKELSCLIFIALCTLIIPVIWSIFPTIRLIIKYKTLNTKPYVIYDALRGNSLDSCLFISLISTNTNEAFIMLTMKDRKVYVGNVISLGEPNEKGGPEQSVVISPIISGYRDKDTLDIFLTTNYSRLDDTTKLILNKSEILSAINIPVFKNRQTNDYN
ncbi:hypothetical protein SENE111051_24205 [Serratia nematodiphila]|uniref:Uncharacterized protein n=1 Tax=Serratia nematodiphila TaxID=458197 RepID=A0A1G5LQD0_9GAMM|nr:hypothetical protein [Serratia nematodiphila]SCZ15056.1 hypothetical protein SAMN02927935_04714 [Serratia nematodiphila]